MNALGACVVRSNETAGDYSNDEDSKPHTDECTSLSSVSVRREIILSGGSV